MYSYMRTFPLKVHYNCEVGWYEATNAHFHRDYYKRRKLGGLLGTTTKSVRSTDFQIFYWTVGKVWKLIPLKKGSLKVHTLKNFPPRVARRNYFTFFSAALFAVQHGLYTSNLLPTPMQYQLICHTGEGLNETQGILFLLHQHMSSNPAQSIF